VPSALPLLPGCPRLVMPVDRVIASTREVSPRASSCSRVVTSTLAGVSRALRSSRLPVPTERSKGVSPMNVR
jgi:hypothetical protein